MKDIITKIEASWWNPWDKGNQTKGTTTLPDSVGNKEDTLTGDVTSIVNNVIAVLGLVCVVVMIIGGINYITSSGDAGKVQKAKLTILYGLIGLVVCALAFALVNWVIGSILGQ